jgi:hypothetical protein
MPVLKGILRASSFQKKLQDLNFDDEDEEEMEDVIVSKPPRFRRQNSQIRAKIVRHPVDQREDESPHQNRDLLMNHTDERINMSVTFCDDEADNIIHEAVTFDFVPPSDEVFEDSVEVTIEEFMEAGKNKNKHREDSDSETSIASSDRLFDSSFDDETSDSQSSAYRRKKAARLLARKKKAEKILKAARAAERKARAAEKKARKEMYRQAAQQRAQERIQETINLLEEAKAVQGLIDSQFTKQMAALQTKLPKQQEVIELKELPKEAELFSPPPVRAGLIVSDNFGYEKNRSDDRGDGDSTVEAESIHSCKTDEDEEDFDRILESRPGIVKPTPKADPVTNAWNEIVEIASDIKYSFTHPDDDNDDDSFDGSASHASNHKQARKS